MKKRRGSSSNSYGDMMNCTPSELFFYEKRNWTFFVFNVTTFIVQP